MVADVFVLGGAQTDFARNYHREGHDLFDLFAEVLDLGFSSVRVDPSEIQAAHVGNFASEQFCCQGHLGGFFAAAQPRMDGIAAQRHEAACASGSMALLSAMADIESGRYNLVVVMGIELMRNVPTDIAVRNIGAPAMWSGRECHGVKNVWPHLYSELTGEYQTRFGLDHSHLAEIARINFSNAVRNRNAQTRGWTFSKQSFLEDDEANPVVAGMLRRHDCSQITDGAALVFLANATRAHEIANRGSLELGDMPRILGWGHRCSHIAYTQKILASRTQEFVFPHVRRCILDAYGRARIPGPDALDGIETHDCFTISEYMAIEHFGITAPGEAWKVIEQGNIAANGSLPINPSGGLIGLGHPVGATGVRMLLDCAKQVSGSAEAYQVANAKRFAMLNLGGSATTAACFVVGAGSD